MRCNHAHYRLLLRIQEGDRRALAPKAAAATNAVNVILLVLKGWQIEVKDHAHTLHINAAGQQIGRNQNARLGSPELLHAQMAHGLRHRLTVDHRNREPAIRKRLEEPLRTILRVREDNGLRNADGLKDVADAVELLCIIIQRHGKLLDALQAHIGYLERNPDRIRENLRGQLADLRRHRRGEEGHLASRGKAPVELDNLSDLIAKAVAEHLIGLIEHKAAKIRVAKIAGSCQIVDTAGGADYNMGACTEFANVLVPRAATYRKRHIDLLIGANGLEDVGNLLGKFVGVC